MPHPSLPLKSGRFCAIVLVGYLLAVCLGACASTADTSTPDNASTPDAAQKTLHAGSSTYFYAMSADPASDWDSWYLQYYGIVENLFRVSDDLTAEPWLAESIENIDELTWKITLRDGLTFSNGQPVDGAAVKAAWDRTYAENPRGQETLALTSVEADGNTLTLTTARAVPGLENVLCDPLLCIYYVGDEVDYAADTPATGPYRFSEFVPEDHAVLVPNVHYWNGTPKLDSIRLTSFSDDNATALALQSGEIQAIAMPDASVLASIASDDRFETYQRVNSRADFIRFNMDHPIVANEAIRAAIACCIDRDGYASVICGGGQVPSWGVYSDTLPFGGTDGLDVAITEASTEEARRILDEAGIVDANGDGIRELDGTPLNLNFYVCTRYGRFVSLADDLQSKLMAIGVKLNIIPVDYFLEDAETFAAADPDLTLDSYAMAPTGNPAYFASMSFATGASNNFGHYSSAEVDALINELNDTYDTSKRNALARQIAQIILDDLPYVFFSNAQTTIVADRGVTGLAAAPSEYYFITVDTNIA